MKRIAYFLLFIFLILIFPKYLVLPLIFIAAILLPYVFYEMILLGMFMDIEQITDFPLYTVTSILVILIVFIVRKRMSFHV